MLQRAREQYPHSHSSSPHLSHIRIRYHPSEQKELRFSGHTINQFFRAQLSAEKRLGKAGQLKYLTLLIKQGRMGEFEKALVEAMKTCPVAVPEGSKGISTEVEKHLGQHFGMSSSSLNSTLAITRRGWQVIGSNFSQPLSMNKTMKKAIGVITREEYTVARRCDGTAIELVKLYTDQDHDEQQEQQAVLIPKNLTAGYWYEANSDHSERTGRRDLVLAQIAHRNRRETNRWGQRTPLAKERLWGCSKCGCLVAQQCVFGDAVEGADMHPS